MIYQEFKNYISKHKKKGYYFIVLSAGQCPWPLTIIYKIMILNIILEGSICILYLYCIQYIHICNFNK